MNVIVTCQLTINPIKHTLPILLFIWVFCMIFFFFDLFSKFTNQFSRFFLLSTTSVWYFPIRHPISIYTFLSTIFPFRFFFSMASSIWQPQRRVSHSQLHSCGNSFSYDWPSRECHYNVWYERSWLTTTDFYLTDSFALLQHPLDWSTTKVPNST